VEEFTQVSQNAQKPKMNTNENITDTKNKTDEEPNEKFN
jgi:hypothetical protein